jgi:hypothetical protein
MFNQNSQNPSNKIVPATKERIVLGQLGLTCAFILLAFSSCSTASSYRKLANNKITTVQLNDGDTILAEVRQGNYRTPESIAEFAKKWYSLMLGWSGGETAVKLDGKLTIPANCYAAAQMMETQLKQSFLTEFSQLVPPQTFNQNSQLKSSARLRYISEPVSIPNENAWTINVVADWIIFDAATNSEMRAITFNKTLTIQSAAIPSNPLQKKANSLEQLIDSIRAYGLEITEIEEFEA